MSDMLQQMWELQREQQGLWHDWDAMSQSDKDALVKELLLQLYEEVAELQRNLDRSRYHILKRPPPPSAVAIAEAGVDVFKILIALMQLHGIRPSDFIDEFNHKSMVVEQKWQWELKHMAGMTVLLCDLDGCVSDWVKSFIKWASGSGVDLGAKPINDPSLEPMKELFCDVGGFRELDQIPNAVKVLNAWRGSDPNRNLIIVSARPYRRHRRIFADTMAWCNSVGLKFDHILFETDKSEAVRLVQPAKIEAFIEDRGKHALEVAATGVNVYKLPYGSDTEKVSHPHIECVTGWKQIALLLGVATQLNLEIEP